MLERIGLRICLKSWTVPIALFVLCALSFGVLIPSLGFYWDDWPSLVIHKLMGPAGFQQFFSLDRPTTYISYILLMPIFGTDPLLWQIFTLALRWLTAVSLWWLVRLMWPESEDLATWAAVLFAVFPIFRQQPIALTYHQLWMQYLFYAISLAGMIAAIRQPARYRVWTGLALAAYAANFLISEYFLGMDLIRPLFLWLAVISVARFTTLRQRLKATMLAWAPYLAVFCVYLAWRFLFMDLPGPDRNAPTLLLSLKTAPFKAIVQLAQMALQDVSYILVSSWYPAFQPNLFDLTKRFSLLALGLTVLTALLACVYLLALRRKTTLEEARSDRDIKLAILLGLVLVVVSPLPGWATQRQITIGAWSDRLAVPAMFGASLALAGLIAFFIRRRWQQILLVCILVGLACGYNLRTANDYRWARVQQNRFYWQLAWRAPGIEPGTAIYSEAELLPKTGLYSTASGINIIYATPSPSGKLPYWFYSLSDEFGYRLNELNGGMALKKEFRNFTFEGASQNGLVVFLPADADCLRIVSLRDIHDPKITPLIAQALPVSNLARIESSPAQPHLPAADIFGPEPERGWCYLFEKGDLARQNGDWQTVVQYAAEAKAQGYSLQNLDSNTPQEWLPFIEGYAHLGRWSDAQELSSAVYEKEPKMAPRLCDLWQDIRKQVRVPDETAQSMGYLNCKNQ